MDTDIIGDLKEEYLLNINNIIENNRNYGRNNIGNSKKIILEFLSPNLPEFLTINEGREIIYIDNLARILSFCGYDVMKEYYIQDSDDNLENMEKIKKDLDIFRINFEKYTYESDLNKNCLIENTLSELRYTNACYINNNSMCLKISNYEAKEDLNLIKEDGSYANILSIITHYNDIVKKQYDKIITTKNMNNPIKFDSIKASLKILGQNTDNIDIKNIKDVNLIGTNVDLNLMNLIKKIDINTIRYFLTSSSIGDSINLNIDLSIATSKENPIYYIEDINAKICTILANHRQKIKKVDKFTTLNTKMSYNILKSLYDFQNIIIESCKKNSPTILTNYIYELTKLFDLYDSNEKIITEDEIYTNERLNLLLAIKIVLNNALNLIGIIPREEI